MPFIFPKYGKDIHLKSILLTFLPILTLLIASGCVFADENYTFPHIIDKNANYVFYSHGYIVEGKNPVPIHERWGKYDFPAIKRALADTDYHLIAAHRPENTDPFKYAKQLARQVNQLIASEVPAKNISLIGFSRGGFITAITSSYLKNKDVNFIILAACTSGLAKRKEIVIYGHLFSVYETSDSVGSCREMVARRVDTVSSFAEISISTGKEHGAFYSPRKEWLLPVKNWLKRHQSQ